MIIQKKPDYLIFADSAKKGEVTDFPDVSRGWGITIDQTASKPPLEWMNGAFNRIDKNMLYLLQQGVPEWSESVTYPANAIIKYNGFLYTALVDNDNANPSKNTSKWRKIQADDFNALPAQKTMNGNEPIYEVGHQIEFKQRPKFSNSAITTFRDFVGSLNKNGYLKLPNGLYVQWGSANYAVEDGEAGSLVPFNIPFPNECFAIITNDGWGGVNSTAANPISKSYFKCWGKNPLGSYANTGLFYIAIGF